MTDHRIPVRRHTGRDIRRVILELAHGADVVECCHCRGPVLIALSGNDPAGPTIEHRTPISLGGTNDLDNLAIAHRGCNIRRGARPPDNPGTHSRKWL